MIVGGSLGTLKMVWVVWRQVSSRRYERLEAGRSDPSREGTLSAAGSRIADVLLTAFLVVWFVLGNLWILGIYWPDFEPTLFEPDRWCHKTLYVFALVHLVILYSVLAALLTFAVGLITCQICLCPILISCK
ncbi:hypothetical protein AAG570_009173 [Ranatra chinensis]|uniref:Uncharacterized protein n=1 Tax=Ranatra chinensis TaxID=642074 RepID=A0ABD0YSZ2_9HEMI